MSWLLLLVATGAGAGWWVLWRAPSQAARLPRTQAIPTRPLTQAIPTRPLTQVLSNWRERRQGPDYVMQTLILIDADLQAGVSPQGALSNALANTPETFCANTRAACLSGGDVAASLSADAQAHAETTWALLSACWSVSHGYGASLSTMLTYVLGVCRQQRRAEQQLRSQLAAPQAGAKLLAGLPLLGIGLGLMLGANPIGWLFGSIAGWLVLTIAIIFEGTGVFWVGRIIKKASPKNHSANQLSGLAPLAAYLIAACAKAGVSLPVSLEVSAKSLGEPIRAHLLGVVRHLRLGADPTQAWAPLKKVPSLWLLAQVMTRSASTGAPITKSLIVVAEAAQDELSARLERQARVAGVKVVAPLALCFLPAFMLVTVVPIVGSLLPTVLSP